jgi:hypothetical protein
MIEKAKKGDWVFCEYKLQRVTDVEDGRITGVSDGYMSTGGHSLNEECFSMNIDIKRISDGVKYWSDKIHGLKCGGLNHPDIHRELLRRWVEICDNKDNEEKMEELYGELANFAKSIIFASEKLVEETVSGIKVFR